MAKVFMASVRMASLFMANVFKAKVFKNQAGIVKDDVFISKISLTRMI